MYVLNTGYIERNSGWIALVGCVLIILLFVSIFYPACGYIAAFIGGFLAVPLLRWYRELIFGI